MIRIGTSGWNYPHWKGRFYPADLPTDRWLEFYHSHFDTVELNKSFYNLPDPEQFASWKDQVPESFLFAVKASRYITHMKKLKDPEASTARFLEHVRALGGRLGPILFQLPPHWKANPGRLSGVLDTLPSDLLATFEFRDTSWITDEVLRLLRSHNAAFCVYELAGYRSPVEITSSFTYVRLHGPGAAYEGSYNDATLSAWAEWARARNGEGCDVYLYFDNDENAYAAHNAARLLELV